MTNYSRAKTSPPRPRCLAIVAAQTIAPQTLRAARSVAASRVVWFLAPFASTPPLSHSVPVASRLSAYIQLFASSAGRVRTPCPTTVAPPQQGRLAPSDGNALQCGGQALRAPRLSRSSESKMDAPESHVPVATG